MQSILPLASSFRVREGPVLIACWSAKGGSGTSVVAASLALILARAAPGVALADLAGDLPAVLGQPDPSGAGLADWLAAGPDVAADALARLEVEVQPGLTLLPWTAAGQPRTPAPPVPAEHARRLAAELAAGRRAVVDCGVVGDPVSLAVAEAAAASLLVVRPCYLALRRALHAPVSPTGVIVVEEPERSLRVADIEDILGVAVRAVVPYSPAVARAVDAGLLASRMPRPLVRALRHAA